MNKQFGKFLDLMGGEIPVIDLTKATSLERATRKTLESEGYHFALVIGNDARFDRVTYDHVACPSCDCGGKTDSVLLPATVGEVEYHEARAEYNRKNPVLLPALYDQVLTEFTDRFPFLRTQ